MLAHNASSLLRVTCGGQDGVGLFFVLSGFLVTRLLLLEYERTGTVSIPHFYFRRAMRILPPLLFYLLNAVCIGITAGTPISTKVIYSVLFFFHNMSHQDAWMVEHTWSLAVEEQFYLLWPVLFLALLRFGRRKLAVSLLVLIACAPLIRIGGHFLHWEWLHHKESFLLPTRMDALLSGAIVACLEGSDRFERLYRMLARFWWLAPSFLFVVSPWFSLHYWIVYDYSVGYLLNSLAGAFFILWLSRNEHTLPGRVANWAPIARVGVMSYSVYLWQTMGVHYSDGLLKAFLGLVFIASMSSLSFHAVEQPAAHLRSYLDRRWFRVNAKRPVAGDIVALAR